MSLAIECGATSSVAAFLPNQENGQIKRFHFGPANFKLMKEVQLEQFLYEIKATTSKLQIERLAIAMAGIMSEQDKKMAKKVVNNVWTDLNQIWVGNDLESAMACIDSTKYKIKCIVISGTGSCCYGEKDEKKAKVGGYGHILGDNGSGYAIAHLALRKALKDFEYHHLTDKEVHDDMSVLLNVILKQLGMNSIYELVGWSLCASKSEIADLASVVLRQWINGNAIAKSVVETAIEDLSSDLVCLVNKLKNGSQVDDNEINIGFTGSLLSKNDKFAEAVIKRVREKSLNGPIVILKDTVMGGLKKITGDESRINQAIKNGSDCLKATNEELNAMVLPISTSLPVTEQRNPRSMNLDTMTISEAIDLMLSEESSTYKEIAKSKDKIEVIIKRITNAFKTGGRLFYVGAGTSGRLGVLDASECVPTFKSPPHWVQGIIAGGEAALRNPIEGAEDVITDGIKAIDERNVNENDVVIGIAACGRTPFVWGSLYGAKQRKAFTCLLTFNPNLEFRLEPDMVISVNIGPEVLTGSTRLKSGSATKCILNMFTTLAMVQYGKCLENLMVDVMPSNNKLRDRSLRITLTIVNNDKVSKELAQKILVHNNYDIKKTVKELRSMLENNMI